MRKRCTMEFGTLCIMARRGVSHRRFDWFSLIPVRVLRDTSIPTCCDNSRLIYPRLHYDSRDVIALTPIAKSKGSGLENVQSIASFIDITITGSTSLESNPTNRHRRQPLSVNDQCYLRIPNIYSFDVSAIVIVNKRSIVVRRVLWAKTRSSVIFSTRSAENC